MKETRSNILKAALGLFNKQGFVNVRLQHIADKAWVSVGNLAYHFENKQEILLALYNQIAKLQRDLLNELNIVPLFEHLDRHWNNVFKVQETYRFFYIDTLEILRSNKSIEEKHQNHINWEVQQLQQMLMFNISRGAINGLPGESDVQQLARLLWMCENLWHHQSLITGSGADSSSGLKQNPWYVIKPYFTEIGKQEYAQLQDLKKTPHTFE